MTTSIGDLADRLPHVDPTEARNVAGSGPDDWAVRHGGNRPGSVPSRPALHPGGPSVGAWRNSRAGGARGSGGDLRYLPVFPAQP